MHCHKNTALSLGLVFSIAAGLTGCDPEPTAKDRYEEIITVEDSVVTRQLRRYTPTDDGKRHVKYVGRIDEFNFAAGEKCSRPYYYTPTRENNAPAAYGESCVSFDDYDSFPPGPRTVETERLNEARQYLKKPDGTYSKIL